MAEVVAIVKIENLPLYTDMAEFIIAVATTDDTLPVPIRARAIEIGQRLQAMLAPSETSKKEQEPC